MIRACPNVELGGAAVLHVNLWQASTIDDLCSKDWSYLLTLYDITDGLNLDSQCCLLYRLRES